MVTLTAHYLVVLAMVAAGVMVRFGAVAAPYLVSTRIGVPGSPGQSDSASFDEPNGIVRWGNSTSPLSLIVVDTRNHALRLIVVASGGTKTFAGALGSNGAVDGLTFTSARFNGPTAIAYALSASVLLVSDTGNHQLRELSLQKGNVTTVAGHVPRLGGSENGVGVAAGFLDPFGLAASLPSGDTIFVADSRNNMIRAMNMTSYNVTTLAGSTATNWNDAADGADARFSRPRGVVYAIVSGTAFLFVADAFNHVIRRVNVATTEVTTIAGMGSSPGSLDGGGSLAQFRQPQGLLLAELGQESFVLLVVDTGNHAVRAVNLTSTAVTTVSGVMGVSSGTNGLALTEARWNAPGFLVSLGPGNIAVSDTVNHVIRAITLPMLLGQAGEGTVQTIAGTMSVRGSDASGRLTGPSGVRVSPIDGALFIAEVQNHVIRMLPEGSDIMVTVAGAKAQSGTQDAQGTNARFSFPWDLAFDSNGHVYITDSGNLAVRKMDRPSFQLNYFVGSNVVAAHHDDLATLARFMKPLGICARHGPNFSTGLFYVADEQSHTIRMFTTPVGNVTTVAGVPTIAGSGPDGYNSMLSLPRGVAVSTLFLYIVETGGAMVRRMSLADGFVTLIAGSSPGFSEGTGTAASFNFPCGVAVDTMDDDVVFVADQNNNMIRRLQVAANATSADVTRVAGALIPGVTDDALGDEGRFYGPAGLAMDRSGNLLVADQQNGAIRLVHIPRPTATTTTTMSLTTSPTATETSTTTLTVTPTDTSTETSTTTPTGSVTSTATATSTESNTPTLTSTGTTSTETGAPTETVTPTTSGTSSATAADSATASFTASASATQTNTTTVTSSLSATTMPSASATPLPTSTTSTAPPLNTTSLNTTTMPRIVPASNQSAAFPAFPAAVVVSQVSVSVASIAALSTPGTAAWAQRVAGALGLLKCSYAVEPPSTVDRPFTWAVDASARGDEQALPTAWALASIDNVILLAIMLVVRCGGGVLQAYLLGEDDLVSQLSLSTSSFRAALLVTRWPGCLVAAGVAVFGRGLEASVISVSAGSTVAGWVCVLGWTLAGTMVPLAAVWAVLQAKAQTSGFFSSVVPVPLSFRAPWLARVHRFVHGMRRWVPRQTGQVVEADGAAVDMHYRYEAIYGDYVDNRLWFLAADFCLSLCMTVAGAIRSRNVLVCLSSRVAVVLLATATAALCLYLRPFLRPVDMVQSVLISSLAAVTGVLILSEQTDLAQVVGGVAMVGCALRLALDAAMVIYLKMPMFRDALKRARLLALKANEGSGVAGHRERAPGLESVLVEPMLNVEAKGDSEAGSSGRGTPEVQVPLRPGSSGVNLNDVLERSAAPPTPVIERQMAETSRTIASVHADAQLTANPLEHTEWQSVKRGAHATLKETNADDDDVLQFLLEPSSGSNHRSREELL